MSTALPSAARSKYLSLLTPADVDGTGPDVYETPDEVPNSRSKGGSGTKSSDNSMRRVDLYSGSVTEIEEYAGESDEDDYDESQDNQPSISRARLDMGRASQRFVGAQKRGGVVDSSGLAFVSGVRATKGKRWILQDNEAGSLEEDVETPTERLARLKSELFELQEHLSAKGDSRGVSGKGSDADGKSKGASYASLLSHVSSLQSKLDEVGGLVGVAPATSTALRENRDQRLQQELVGRIKAFKAVPSDLATLPSNQALAVIAPPSASQQQSGSVTYELHYTPATSRLAHLTRLAQLESRLSSLEKLVGASDLLLREVPDAGLSGAVPGATGHPTVLSTLSHLDELLTLVTSKPAMDALIPRVRRIVAELERAAELSAKGGAAGAGSPAHARAGSASTQSSPTRLPSGSPSLLPGGGASANRDGAGHTDDDQLADPNVAAKVSHLHSLLAPISPIVPALPHIVARLRALRGLHSEQARLAASVATLAESQKDVDGEVRRLAEVLEKVERGLKDTEDRVKGNVDEVAKRWDDVLKRWEKLKVGK
ncbi:hypothetical protein M427DRAFT_152618 [Gonapodya prolifera JEL478]|uniref:Dynamitin-domain-containing protein n=1 Tax=Gonapodya prolifera (strain JEL478) TaxID=1344416 RepID=A0A139AQQ1_GONPJ|nr:hypothetical protein M427DRAFT_152618 [Gonapodya prolifera JEL478]|eukprot:KXS19091.1 hypothetical protein M427DRAFT_152618 [Gonapodya prolifera JEL478]